MENTNTYKKMFDEIHAAEETKQRILSFHADTAAEESGESGSKETPYPSAKKSCNAVIPKLPKRMIPAAAAFLILFAVSSITYAAARWSGFSKTGNMSEDEINRLLNETTQTASAATDPSGNVHYYDLTGNETMVLSPEEEKQYREKLAESELKELQKGTSLADISSFWPYPSGIMELPLSSDGIIPDFALGSGCMVILYPEDTTGFSLHSGDRLTVKINSNDDCYLAFYVIRDGINQKELEYIDLTQNHSFTFDVTEDGEYCIALMYYSAAASNFTDGQLQIETVPTAACEVPLLPADL